MSIMKMVYQAGLNNGLSPNQARAFTAEVGRENDFNPKYIFGEHRDSNRDNVGIISWNQGRRTNLYRYLQKKAYQPKMALRARNGRLMLRWVLLFMRLKQTHPTRRLKNYFLTIRMLTTVPPKRC